MSTQINSEQPAVWHKTKFEVSNLKDAKKLGDFIAHPKKYKSLSDLKLPLKKEEVAGVNEKQTAQSFLQEQIYRKQVNIVNMNNSFKS